MPGIDLEICKMLRIFAIFYFLYGWSNEGRGQSMKIAHTASDYCTSVGLDSNQAKDVLLIKIQTTR